MSYSEALIRAQRGAELLDEKKPQWRSHINVGRLDMFHPGYCVLGQLFGDYLYGLRALELSDLDALRLGFESSNDSDAFVADPTKPTYAELRDAWRTLAAGVLS